MIIALQPILQAGGSQYLQSNSKRRMKLSIRYIIIVFIILTVGIWIFFPLSDPLFDKPYSTVLLSRKGELLGARIAQDGQWRFPPSDSLPDKYVRCLIQLEDKYFIYHPGVNPFSLIHAFYQNITSGKIISGGSTITMQLARMARGNKERTVYQKLVEIWLAVRLEMKYSKDEILKLYASHAPFGGNVVGIKAASWRYYGRSPFDLSWSEITALTVLPNSPGLLFPGNNDPRLAEKRDRLLKNIHHMGWIEELELKIALDEPVPSKPMPLPNHAPHLLDRIIKEQPEGRQFETTLNFQLQKTVNQIIDDYHEKYKYKEIHNAAAIVVDIKSGEVKAYVGNVAEKNQGEHGQAVDIITSKRSPGSLLKPLLYAMSIDEGLLAPHQLLPDIPMYFQGFAPQNFDKKFKGAVYANQALINSLNVPFVFLLKNYGYEKMHSQLKKMGCTSFDKTAGHYGLTLILGGAEITLWEITGLYAGMARTLFRYQDAIGENKYNIDDYRANTYLKKDNYVSPYVNEKNGIISAGAIWHTLKTMQELRRPEESSKWERFRSSIKIAWKTGTSYGHKDAWAIGINSKYVVGVWLGNADGEGRPDLTGITAASPLMFSIFKLLDGDGEFPQPVNEMKVVKLCRQSGLKANGNCPDTELKLLSKSVLNTGICTFHRIIHLDKNNHWQVNSSCYPVKDMHSVSWFILPPAQGWYFKKYTSDYEDPPEFLDLCNNEDKDAMEMIYPLRFTRVYVPIEIDGKQGKVIFQAAHRNPDSNIFWHLDDQYIGSTKNNHQIGVYPKSGNHTLNLIDDAGRELLVKFEVLNK